MHIMVTLRCWRAEKRMCCVQDSGTRPAGKEHGTSTTSAQRAQAGRGERGPWVQRRHGNMDRSLPVAPAFGNLWQPASKGLVTPEGWLPVARTSHRAGARYWGLQWPSGPTASPRKLRCTGSRSRSTPSLWPWPCWATLAFTSTTHLAQPPGCSGTLSSRDGPRSRLGSGRPRAAVRWSRLSRPCLGQLSSITPSTGC